MVQPWQQVVALLKDTRRCLQSFLTLLIDEESALKAMDRKILDDITDQKEQILESLRQYDQSVHDSLGWEMGFVSQGSLERELQQAPPQDRTVIRQLVRDLHDLVQRVREQGKRNEGLIQRMQHVVGQAIHLMYSGLGRVPVYQATGGLHFPDPPGTVHISG